MTNTRTTKKDFYNEIIALFSEDMVCDAMADFSKIPTEEVVNFCKHELELLENKSGSSKPTKTQIENESYKVAIIDILTENDRPMTISEMMTDARLSGLKNQRVSALVTQLKKAGVVTRTEEKKVAYFSITE